MSTTPEKTMFPRILDPRKFAQKGVLLEGYISVRDMPRLSGLLLNDTSEINAALEFSINDQRLRTISGSAEGIVQVTCQRCLESVDYSLSAALNLGIVWDEEKANNLPKSIEALILPEGVADIYGIIEDELLLSLPMATYHDHDCISKTSFGEEVVEDDDTEKELNPFQILEQLKGSPKS
jgi:uncharacterized protein